ncbi:MAG TPA: hypothetical protein PLR18_00700 [bacterium]|nr:hypothetical protein [bacterium]
MSDDGTQDKISETNKKEKIDIHKQKIDGMALVANLIAIMTMPIIIFTLAGKYFDNLFHKRFLFILLGGALGIGLGMHFVYKRAEVIRDDLYGKK